MYGKKARLQTLVPPSLSFHGVTSTQTSRKWNEIRIFWKHCICVTIQACHCSRGSRHQTYLEIYVLSQLRTLEISNGVCHSFGKEFQHLKSLQILQFISCTKWFFIQISIIHDNTLLQRCEDVKSTELKVSWDDNTCQLIYFLRSVIRKVTTMVVKYHMTLNDIHLSLLHLSYIR